jgi:dehydrogenase/reductase SDR family protein 1
MSAESTKEATAEGHKVTTVVEGTDATAAPPAEPSGKVAIVTGASRGLGRGVAAVLAKEAGFTVYAAGRTTADLEKLQAECADGPGKVVPCTLDLKDDEAVKAFVEKVGKVDVLVNSAYQGLAVTKPHLGKKFYEQPLSTYDDHMSAVRWAYAMSQLVAPSMVEAKSGLIVNISSGGGAFYLFSTPYGVMHAAMDRLAADMATELKGTGVAAVSLWPGGAVTESTAFPDGETPAFAGRAVAALAAAGDLGAKSGKILMTSELATEYGFVDATGAMPVGGMASGAGVEAQTFFRSLLGKTPPFGGELGDFSQTNNEGLAGCFHGY